MSPAASSSIHRRTVLVVEPFFGGSHRAFLEGLARHSAHRITRVTMPAELWRWRLRASALALAGPVAEKARRADVILASFCDGCGDSE